MPQNLLLVLGCQFRRAERSSDPHQSCRTDAVSGVAHDVVVSDESAVCTAIQAVGSES